MESCKPKYFYLYKNTLMLNCVLQLIFLLARAGNHGQYLKRFLIYHKNQNESIFVVVIFGWVVYFVLGFIAAWSENFYLSTIFSIFSCMAIFSHFCVNPINLVSLIITFLFALVAILLNVDLFKIKQVQNYNKPYAI